MTLHSLRSWSRRATLASIVTLAVALLGSVNVRAASATTTTVTFWIQTMDSCQQAIPRASYTLKGNKITYKAGPGPGTKPVTVGSGQGCPLQRGNCVTVPTGCVSFVLPVPGSGTSKVYYTGTQSVTPSGYVPCTGGSACRKEFIKLTVFSTGAMSATVTNVYPDGYTLVWPTGSHYTGAQTDPAVFHSFGIGTISCDGDADADDHLTGSPSTHCDSEAD